MNYYVHNIPGRLRIKIPSLKSDEVQCEQVKEDLGSLDGISRITVNVLTGSVVVHYDKEILGAEAIMTTLTQEGHLQPAVRGSDPFHVRRATSKASAAVGKAFFGWAVEKALEPTGLSILAALI